MLDLEKYKTLINYIVSLCTAVLNMSGNWFIDKAKHIKMIYLHKKQTELTEMLQVPW